MSQMFPTFEEWLSSTYRPLMGGETLEDEHTDAEDGEGSSEEEGESGGSAGAAGSEGHEEEESHEEEDPSSESDEDDADLDELGRVRGERDKAREELAAAQAAVRREKAAARKAREDAAKKGGNWEQVAKEREAEIADLSERLQGSETRRVAAEEDLDAFRREVRVTSISARLGFRDPQDAINALANKPESTGDDKSCERALRKLAESKPYLVDIQRVRGRSMNGDASAGGGFTAEQVARMSEADVIKNWDKISASLPGMRRPQRSG